MSFRIHTLSRSVIVPTLEFIQADKTEIGNQDTIKITNCRTKFKSEVD